MGTNVVTYAAKGAGMERYPGVGPGMRIAVVPLIVAIVFTAVPSSAAAQSRPPLTTQAVQAVIETSVTTVYRPAQAAFLDAARTLERQVRTLCDPSATPAPADGASDTAPDIKPDTASGAPSGDALASAQAAFADAVVRFSETEPLRVGPLLEDNRLNRLFYWPDKRRVGERQLRALLAEPATTLTTASMPGRSVALQGLPALERLLYPSTAAGLAVLIDRKLAPRLTAEPPTRRGAPFARSGLDGAHVGGNIAGLRALAIDTGLAGLADLDKELAFEFRVAAGHAASLDERARAATAGETLATDEAALGQALLSTLDSIRDTVRERLAPALGVRTGFNANDGD